ncbi:MAG: hypothetical protein Q8P97_02140 [bacterium]|nr:hypothetical protein [bacterium]
MDEPNQHTWIGDYYVSYNEADYHEGIGYLQERLPKEELKVLFDKARDGAESKFRNQNNIRFEISYEGGGYVITRKN